MINLIITFIFTIIFLFVLYCISNCIVNLGYNWNHINKIDKICRVITKVLIFLFMFCMSFLIIGAFLYKIKILK